MKLTEENRKRLAAWADEMDAYGWKDDGEVLRQLLASDHPEQPAAAPVDEPKYTQADMERYGKAYADARDARRAVPAPADERAAFEAWARVDFSFEDEDIGPFVRDKSGYLYVNIDSAWAAWQATRAASVDQTAAAPALAQQVIDTLKSIGIPGLIVGGSHEKLCALLKAAERALAASSEAADERATTSLRCEHNWTWADGKCVDCGVATPTTGMTLGKLISHVGGRVTQDGGVEFGSVMAVDALILHVMRDARAASARSD
jgi:hypothetical protein